MVDSEKIVIESKALTKKYGDSFIVRNVDLQIRRGECFGLLGPNGAGKSTTMKMLYGGASITSGELYILGINAKKNITDIKARIGVVPQEDGLDHDFSVYENLALFASYFGLVGNTAKLRIEELLKLFRLEEYSERPVEELSGGIRRRLAIARGLLNKPEILVMDEPSSGLDPQSRLWIWNFLRSLKQEMGTLIISTHFMEEAQEICDRIAIMDNSKILKIGEPKYLIESEIGKEIIECNLSTNDISYYSNRLAKEKFQFNVVGKQIHVYVKKDQEAKSVFEVISGYRMTIRPANLSDVFFKLTGHDLREEPL